MFPVTLVLWCVPPPTNTVSYSSRSIPIEILICTAYVWKLVSPELWVSGTCATTTNTASHEISRPLCQATLDRHIGSIQVTDTGWWCNGAVSGTKQSRGMKVPRPLMYLSPPKRWWWILSILLFNPLRRSSSAKQTTPLADCNSITY